MIFYFSRTAAPKAFGKYLVSGVIEAASEEDALAQITTALRKARHKDTAQDFHLQDLVTASRANPYGLLAITTAEED